MSSPHTITPSSSAATGSEPAGSDPDAVQALANQPGSANQPNSADPSGSADQADGKLSPDSDTADTNGDASSQTDRSRWLLLNVILPLVILAIGGIVILALGKVEPSRRAADDTSPLGILKSLPEVRTMAVRSLAASGERLQLAADGEVVPYREAEVAAEVAGRIISKQAICEAGQFVRAGDELMQIDRTDLELQVESLQRSQEQAYEALKEIDQEIAGNQRLIDVAKRDVQLQIREVRRQRALPDGFNRATDIDAAEKALLVAEQAMVTLENRVSLLRAQRSRQEAAERQAATQLKVANINLERSTIVAPIDGMIVRENADVDSFVQRGTPLVTIETIDKVEVDSKLRVDQLHWVLSQRAAIAAKAAAANNDAADGVSGADPGLSRSNDPANRFAGYKLPKTDCIISYELSGLENQVYRWRGQLISYDGIGLDPQTRTIPVRIIVDDPQQNVDKRGNPIEAPGSPALVRGMFVSILLQIVPSEDLVIVPATAMQPGNRVLQFIEDESVLVVEPEEPETMEESSDEDQTLAADDTSSSPAPEQDDAFDPDRWMAGRVVLRKNITPIDSLSTADMNDAPDSDAPNSDAAVVRSWVCAVRDGSLVDGSLVVVSPVGNFEGNSMPARAARGIESADPAMVDRTAEAAQTALADRKVPAAKAIAPR